MNDQKFSLWKHVKNIFIVVIIFVIIMTLTGLLANYLEHSAPIFKSSCNEECLFFNGPPLAQSILGTSLFVVSIILTILLSIRLLKIKFFQAILYSILAFIICWIIYYFALGIFSTIWGFPM